MSKLVDKERLAKLAQALDARMKAAVKAENERALAAEQAIDAKAVANAEAIAAINNEENGILAKAKAHVAGREEALQGQINDKVAQADYDAKVAEIKGIDDQQDADILALQNAVDSLETKMGDKDMAGIQDAIDEFKEEQQGVDAAQDQRIDDLEVRVKGREAAEGVEAVVGLEAEMDAVEERVQAIEDADFAQQIADEATARGNEDVKLAGLIDGLDDRVAANEAFVAAQPAKDQAQDAKIEALEKANAEGGAVANAIAQVAQDLADFEAEQATKEQQQDDAIAAKVAQTAYDTKVGELVAEDQRLDQAIKDEATAARAAEKANADAIAAINNADDGILAQAKAFAQEQVNAEKGLREAADNALDGRLDAVEASIAEGGALEGRVAANEAKLAGLEEGCNTVQAAIDKAEADAKAHAEQKIADLVDSAPDAMNTLNELAAAINANQGVYDAYVAEHAAAMTKMKEDLQAEIDSDIAAARTLISAEIDTDVKAEADRAKAEEADIRADFATADAQVLVDAKAYADQEVGKEKDRAMGVEAAIRQEMEAEAARVDEKIADDIAAESVLRVAEEGKIRGEFAAEDTKLSNRIATLEGLVVGGEGEGLEAVIADVAQNKADIEDLKDADVELQTAIDGKVAQSAYDNKVAALEGADSALDNRIKVFEANGELDVAALKARVAEAEGDIDDLEAFVAGHDHEAMKADIAANAKAIADNRKTCQDEMAQEVLDRNAAIATALEDYATSEEMMAILGNVVNSLALTMENNKVVLRLGGKDGIAVTEVSLDIVTDADIEEMVANLDK